MSRIACNSTEESQRREGALARRLTGVFRRDRADGPILLAEIREVAAWDGRGYPDGIAGESIPFGARIIAAAHAYVSLVTDRAYRRSLTRQGALDALREDGGRRWDPAVVHVLSEQRVSRAIACGSRE